MKNLLIITGKSASGKDSILNILNKDFNFERIVTCTTRPIRDNETDGVDYYFLSDKEFDLLVKNNRFAEYREYNSLFNNISKVWKYGTLKQKLSSSKNYVIVLELKGAKELKEYYGDQCQVIYIQSNDEIRRQRAEQRGSFSETEWNRRLEADKKDFTDDKKRDIIDIQYNNNDCDINELTKTIYRNFI